MRPSTILHGLTTATSLLMLAPTPRANACSGPPCLPDQFVPHAGSLPANAAGVVWFPGFRYEHDIDAGDDGYRETQQGDLRFVCTKASGVTRDVPFHVDDYPEDCGRTFCEPRFLIVPDIGLVEGESCEIAPTFTPCDTGWAGDDPPPHLRGSARFDVAAEADLPDNLSGVTAYEPHNATILVGSDPSCDAPVDACVLDVKASLGSAEPWRDALIFHTWVNGERWQPRSHYWLPMPTGGSWLGRGNDRLFRAAPGSFTDDPGLAAIDATVLITAELPGTEASLQAAPIAVRLECGGEVIDGGFTCDGGGEPHVDGPVGVCDSGFVLDATVSDADDSGADTHDGGCSCSVVGPRSTQSWSWLGGLAGIAMIGARRVRASQARRGMIDA